MSTLYANTLILKGNPSVELTAQTASKSNVSILKSDKSLAFPSNQTKVFEFEPAASSSLSLLVKYDNIAKDFTFKKGVHIISAQVHVSHPLCTQRERYVAVMGDKPTQNTMVTDNNGNPVKVVYIQDAGSGDTFTLINRPYIPDPIRLELKAKADGIIIGQSITYLSPTIASEAAVNNFAEPVTFNLIFDLTADKVVTFELTVADKHAMTGDLSINPHASMSLMFVNSFSS